MRPCETCGGSGKRQGTGGTTVDTWNECPSCVDMPWLPCPKGVPIQGGGYMKNACVKCGGRGRFKPDPDTILRWCFEHSSRLAVTLHHAGAELCVVAAGSARILTSCDFGWVARPQRLETIEV